MLDTITEGIGTSQRHLDGDTIEDRFEARVLNRGKRLSGLDDPSSQCLFQALALLSSTQHPI